MLKKILLLSSLYMIGCSSGEMQVYRGCGFSITLPVSYSINRYIGFESLGYKVKNEKANEILLISVGTIPSSPNSFEVEQKVLTQELKIVDEFVDEYGNYGFDVNYKIITFGSSLNVFPKYVQFVYSKNILNDEDASKIMHTIVVEKDSATSKYCNE